MTDFSSRDLDALASDLVDGLLPPEEAARARQDPEVAARVASIEVMRSALRSVPPPDPAMTDRILAAAIAAASSPVEELPQTRRLTAVPPAPPPPPARPVPSSTRRWLAAAAVLLVAGLVTAGLVSSRSGHDEDVADAPSAAENRSPDKAGDSAAPPSSSTSVDDQQSPGGVPETTGPSSPTSADVMIDTDKDLGSVDSAEELSALVAQRYDEGYKREETSDRTGGAIDGNSSDTCPGVTNEGDPSRGTSLFSDDATYDGRPVVVHVYQHNGTHRLVATATDGSCEVVVDVPYGD